MKFFVICIRNMVEKKALSIKLDIGKAYNRMEWPYLESIMQKFSFNEIWIKLVMYCVKSVTFSIMINVEPKGSITPTRGLSQGDSLSLYLFLFCTKWLIYVLSNAIAKNHISGIQICRRAKKINYLLFVNESIHFCKTELEENWRIQ